MPDEVQYLRNADFIHRKIVEEYVLVPLHQNVADMDCVYTLNSVGAFIWEYLEHPASKAELETAMLDEFDAEPEMLAADLEHFLVEMTAIGALREV